MHITIRYGNKEGTPIHHLRESIKEGRCSPRGKSIQGTLKKEIENLHRTSSDCSLKKLSVNNGISTDGKYFTMLYQTMFNLLTQFLITWFSQESTCCSHG